MIISINSFREEAFNINAGLDDLSFLLDETEVLGKAGLLLNENYEAILEEGNNKFLDAIANIFNKLVAAAKEYSKKAWEAIKKLVMGMKQLESAADTILKNSDKFREFKLPEELSKHDLPSTKFGPEYFHTNENAQYSFNYYKKELIHFLEKCKNSDEYLKNARKLTDMYTDTNNHSGTLVERGVFGDSIDNFEKYIHSKIYIKAQSEISNSYAYELAKAYKSKDYVLKNIDYLEDYDISVLDRWGKLSIESVLKVAIIKDMSDLHSEFNTNDNITKAGKSIGDVMRAYVMCYQKRSNIIRSHFVNYIKDINRICMYIANHYMGYRGKDEETAKAESVAFDYDMEIIY